MTGLHIDDFEAFFAAIHDYPPFAWQSRLCRAIWEKGEWPETINAPTGTGKSNVVDVHTFVNALQGWGNGPRVPRRLSVVVNRRAIVDAHEQRALDIRRHLQSPQSQVVSHVTEGLRRLRHESAQHNDVLSLATLRGGILPDRSWVDDPTSCTVICATPDMWGSRLLFGGYGSSPQAHPREAGLLAFDSVMVLDEAHLNLQLLKTARRVRELALRYPSPVPVLQVVETTATPAGSADERPVGVLPDDLLDDPELARRLTRPKPVAYRTTASWPDKRRSSEKYVNEIVESVVELWNDTPAGTIGCIVNTVSTAVRVANAIRDQLKDKNSRNQVLTWVGPMRPLDLTAQIRNHRLAFQPEGDPQIGVIVATQTIEVGIDIDFAALVTELAPGTALTQRAGRVNRLGTRESGPIVVIGPVAEPLASGPYDAEELTQAQTWVLRRTEDPAGLAPLALATDPAPRATARRSLLARLESGDAEALATTSEDLAAPQERSLWLRDDLGPDKQDCSVVLRSQLPQNNLDALVLLQATPPAGREAFPVHIHVARELCHTLGKLESPSGRIFFWRNNTISQVQLGNGEDPRPGDILILDSNHPVVLEHTIVAYGEGSEEPKTVWGSADVEDREVEVYWRSDNPELFEQIEDVLADPKLDADDIQKLVTGYVGSPLQVTVGPPLEGDETGQVPWLVLKPKRIVTDDEEIRQTWCGAMPVPLGTHSDAVAARARALAEHLHLTESEITTLEMAGRHHDKGKQDRRFQIVLGRESGKSILAKSGDASSRQAQLRKARAGLPSGWRHEQLSVVLAYDLLAEHDRNQSELVLRLVGTSHGRGRSEFPHNAEQLIDPQDLALMPVATKFFNCGAWESLIEATHRRHGPWACAFYEALLRAADCTVSKEGS